MDVAILLYNTALTSVLTLAIACAYYLYKRKKKPVFGVLGVMFAVYLVDNTIIFCTECIPQFSVQYDAMFIFTPSFKTIYYMILMGCIMYTVYMIMHPPAVVPFYVAMGVYAVLLICLPMIQDKKWMVFFYYLPTQIYWVAISGWGLLALHKKSDWYCQPFYKTWHRIMIFSVTVATAILLEDTLVIFQKDIYTLGGLKINNRNWSENILFLGLACFFLKYTMVVLADTDLSLLGAVEPESLSHRDPTDAFGILHGLTERECQILALLLDGKSQQEIGDALTIALGTVKTHVHNIYQKMDVTKRSQLMANFQRFIQEPAEAPEPQE